MKEYLDGKALGNQIIERFDYDSVMETAALFGTLSRQTGTPDGEKAAAHILEKVRSYGIETCADWASCLASIPYKTVLHVAAPEEKDIPCLTEAWSKVEDVEGEVVFDALSLRRDLTWKEERDRYKPFVGKVVLTWSMNCDFTFRAKEAGAKAILIINQVHGK